MTFNQKILSLVKKVFSDWNTHNDARWGASLAFYTAMRQISGQMEGIVGTVGAQAISTALESTQKGSAHGVLATLISLLVLLFSASGVFTELRSALNSIWDVKPESSGGIGSMIRDRFFSFGMVLTVAFLLLASLLLSAVLAALSTFMRGLIPTPKVVSAIIDLIVSIATIGVVFALTFRYVPRTGAEWPQAWKGGLFTSVFHGGQIRSWCLHSEGRDRFGLWRSWIGGRRQRVGLLHRANRVFWGRVYTRDRN